MNGSPWNNYYQSLVKVVTVLTLCITMGIFILFYLLNNNAVKMEKKLH